ncbi:MAG: hypothetical protein K0Q74_1392, partial [Gammaproteobacteria bacterium]|nr:hypothetical protein [Gammaproteobacteria bacterium]
MPNRHNAAFFLSDMDHHPSP